MKKIDHAPLAATIMPNAPVIEQSVLGSIFHAAHANDRTLLDEYLPTLSPSDFHTKANQLVFCAISSAYATGGLPDLISVTDRLQVSHELDAAGGAARVTELLDASFGTATLGHHVMLLRQYSAKRLLVEAGHQLTAASANGMDSVGLASLVQRVAIDVTEMITPPSDAAVALREFARRHHHPRGPAGRRTRLSKNDRSLGRSGISRGAAAAEGAAS